MDIGGIEVKRCGAHANLSTEDDALLIYRDACVLGNHSLELRHRCAGMHAVCIGFATQRLHLLRTRASCCSMGAYESVQELDSKQINDRVRE